MIEYSRQHRALVELDRLVAGCGDASDRARFRNYEAPRAPMTNAIGVAKTTIQNRFVVSGAPQAPLQTTLGFVPLPVLLPLRQLCGTAATCLISTPSPIANN